MVNLKMFSRHSVIVISAESLNNHPPFQLASPERKMRICVKQTDFNSQKKEKLCKASYSSQPENSAKTVILLQSSRPTKHKTKLTIMAL